MKLITNIPNYLEIFINELGIIKIDHKGALYTSRYITSDHKLYIQCICHNILCSRHMALAKPTVCHHVVNFVRTAEHGEGTRRGVERSVNTLVAR